MVKISYDAEGDLLEIQFTQFPESRRGIGLTEHITVFYDESIETPTGLTVVSYTKLLALSPLPLSELLDAPLQVQGKVKQSLRSHPLSRFIHLKGDSIALEDIRMSDLVHA